MNDFEHDEFERKVRALPWRKSSNGLRDKVFGDTSEQPSLYSARQRSMPIKWSVVLATAAGFVGFIAGTMLPNRASTTNVASIGTDIRVVETFSARNSFDFSVGAIQILPGEFTTSISVEGEAESQR